MNANLKNIIDDTFNEIVEEASQSTSQPDMYLATAQLLHMNGVSTYLPLKKLAQYCEMCGVTFDNKKAYAKFVKVQKEIEAEDAAKVTTVITVRS